jgi:hypothetical protein
MTEKHEIERAFIVKQGIDAVCQAAEEEGATSTAIADAKMLADMKTKIKNTETNVTSGSQQATNSTKLE